MAATDLVLVQKQYTDPVDSTVTLGLPEQQTLAQIQAGSTATLTAQGSVLQAAFIAQVAVPFADLTAAATAHNALLTALKNAGVMAAS